MRKNKGNRVIHPTLAKMPQDWNLYGPFFWHLNFICSMFISSYKPYLCGPTVKKTIVLSSLPSQRQY